MVAQVRRKHPVRCSMARGAISVGLRVWGVVSECLGRIQEVLFSEFPWSQDFGFMFSVGFGILNSDFRIWYAPLGIRVERPGKFANDLIPYYCGGQK